MKVMVEDLLEKFQRLLNRIRKKDVVKEGDTKQKVIEVLLKKIMLD